MNSLSPHCVGGHQHRAVVMMPISFRSAALLCLILSSAAGCTRTEAQTAPPPPVEITVSRPVDRDVTESVDFTGRTEARFSVDIEARVTGYLEKMPFVEGSEVKTGDVLFEIDSRPYKAQYDQAAASVSAKKATLKLAVADFARAKQLGATGVAAISQQQLESYQAKEDQSRADLESAQAQLESAKINLDFTRITSPIDGRVSRYYVTVGNLVNADSTLLTTVVSEDPIYAYFDADEMTLLKVQRRLMASHIDQFKAKGFPVFMGLADEEGYPHQGYVDFANNVVTSSTGTITIRGVFPNPSSPTGRRLVRPGMFVRIRLPISLPHKAVLVSERAIGSDQGSKFLYVVDADDIVQYRSIKTGPLQEDGLRVISEGLKPDERVVVSGLQLVRPGAKVSIQEEPMAKSAIDSGAGSQKGPSRQSTGAPPQQQQMPRSPRDKNGGK